MEINIQTEKNAGRELEQERVYIGKEVGIRAHFLTEQTRVERKRPVDEQPTQLPSPNKWQIYQVYGLYGWIHEH